VAVVTGGNRGIGLEICKQLAFKGVTVTSTATEDKNAVQAVKMLSALAISNINHHQLVVGDI